MSDRQYGSIGEEMAWRRTGGKLLSGTMLVCCTDAYVLLGLNEIIMLVK